MKKSNLESIDTWWRIKGLFGFGFLIVGQMGSLGVLEKLTGYGRYGGDFDNQVLKFSHHQPLRIFLFSFSFLLWC